MKRPINAILLFVFFLSVCIASAYAGDGVTLVFESGQVVKINDGYTKIVRAMRKLHESVSEHHIVELEIGGSTFVLNVAQVVVVCRDDCRSLEVRHQLDPKRGK